MVGNKGIWVMIIAVLLQLLPRLVFAEYKDEVKPELNKVIADFYQQERGNRVTEYGIRGLLEKIDQTIRVHRVIVADPVSKESTDGTK